MTFADIKADVEGRMKKTVDELRDRLRGVRSGRATPALLEGVKVSYYGTLTPLQQLATISTPDARMIMVKPFDPGSLKEIEKAILAANLGLTPQNDGKIIRIPVPPLSEDRRKTLAGEVKKTGEQSKIAIRNVRRDGMKHAQTEYDNGTLPEDDFFRGKEEIENLTKRYEKELDDVVAKKTQEIMTI